MRPNSLAERGALALRCATAVLGVIFLVLSATGSSAENAVPVSAFAGNYVGDAMVVSSDGNQVHRDMSVQIRETKKGFTVAWTTATQTPAGRTKEKSYLIEFVPSDRPGIYGAAMRRNVFGHAVQLDPMKGEPFIWGRITGKTMTVYSLFVDDQGGYEMQQYDRTLVDGGLQLEFSRFRNGDKMRSVSAFLARK